ncbi:hypothetical protein ENUP19_0047G0055 [Entamoeba nuttalli]|uniref:Rho-GAP domain-containing protein n=1 Tax=Entamoeba nuttalli TaxID=412467 RepID=A0ABQ0DAW6_9EUKA
MDRLGDVMGKAVSVVNAVSGSDTEETEYANSHIKEIEEMESYIKKHRSIANKILDAFSVLTEQIGNMAELHRTRLSLLQPLQKEDQALSVNYLLFIQGNMQLIRDELTKGYGKQIGFISSEIAEVKTLFNKNTRKPVDSVETMTTMLYQLKRLFEIRNKIMQRHQYLAFHLLNCNLNSFNVNNGNIYTAMNQLSDLDNDSEQIHLRSVSYVGRTLGEILDAERRKHSELPRVIEDIINLLENQYYEKEGIFRTAASQKQVNELFHRLSVSDISSFPWETLASTLKRFVRELPGMLFCNSLAKDVLSKYQESEIRETRIHNLTSLFYAQKWVPEEKIVLFKAIVKLCHKIMVHSSKNLMNEKNLSVCWTPTMFSVNNDELSKYLEMMSFIITEADFIFDDTKKSMGLIGNTEVRGKQLGSTKIDHSSVLESDHVQPKMIPKVPLVSLIDSTPDFSNSPSQSKFIMGTSPSQGGMSQQTKFTLGNYHPPKDTQSPRTHQRDPTTRYPMVTQQRPTTMAVPSTPLPKVPPRQKFLQQRQETHNNSTFLLDDD